MERLENIYEINKKLIGKIEPQGETNIDNERFDNLKEMIDLTFKLIDEIVLVARHSNRSEFSISRAGKEANEFINSLRERLL